MVKFHVNSRQIECSQHVKQLIRKLNECKHNPIHRFIVYESNTDRDPQAKSIVFYKSSVSHGIRKRWLYWGYLRVRKKKHVLEVTQE